MTEEEIGDCGKMEKQNKVKVPCISFSNTGLFV